MRIEYLKAKNFFSIGEEPLEVDFTKLGNIVMINGRNYDIDNNNDYSESGDEFYSNASGKSTISECLSYSLYGNVIRQHVSHSDAINDVSQKKLEVEVIFSIDNVRYRIVRTRKPDSIRLWQDGPPWTDSNEITRGGQPATQAQIEEILRMNHKAFVNVVCYGQHNNYNFLDCTPAEQRQIAESLLSLEVYENYAVKAKEKLKETKSKLKESIAAYEQIKSNELLCFNRIKDTTKQQELWLEKCNQDIKSLELEKVKTQTEFDNTDDGLALSKYYECQQQLQTSKENFAKKSEHYTALELAVNQAKDHHNITRERVHDTGLKRQSIEQEIQICQKDIQKCEFEINKLNKLPEGAKCPECYGVIDKQHYKHVANLHKNKKDSLESKLETLLAGKQAIDSEYDKHNKSVDQIRIIKDEAESKYKQLTSYLMSLKSQINQLSSVPKPDTSSKEILLKEKLSQIDYLIANKYKEIDSGGPYVTIINSLQNDLEVCQNNKKEHKDTIDETEGLLPYYDYWSKTFADDIRAFIIEGIVPVLNARIAYWMQYLINGKMKITFDKHLNATIENNPPQGKSRSYFVTCGSERRRINLAISQAFAHVMTISAGTWPSLVFLDEASDSIDQKSIKTIYQMICELSKEKQVFVITHNIHLRNMLEGVDTITMVKQNGFSRLL